MNSLTLKPIFPQIFHIVIVINAPEPLNGKLIKNLVVNDKENADDWSICNDFNIGSKVYGDREITIMNLPSNLANWKAGDMCEDGILDVFDLCVMKSELINQ